MANTIRTDAAILSQLPVGGQRVRAQDVRDFAVTAFIKGGYTPEQRGAVSGVGVSSAVRTANTAAFNNTITDAYADGKPVVIPGKTYEIDGTIDATDKDYLQIQGMGGTVLKQFTDNVPILKMGGSGSNFVYGQVLDGVALTYNARQVGNASATGLQLGGSVFGEFRRIKTENAYDGIAQDRTAGRQATFSCLFTNIYVHTWVNRGMWMEAAAGAANTGSVFQNILMNTAGDHASALDVESGLYITTMAGGSFEQINVEWCRPSRAAIAAYALLGGAFSGVHCEGVSVRSYTGLFNIWDGESTWSDVTVNDCRFRAADGAFAQGIFSLGDNAKVALDAFRIYTITKSGLTLWLAASDDQVNGQANQSFRLGHYTLGTDHAVDALTSFKQSAGSSIKRNPLYAAGAAMGLGRGVYTHGDADLTYKAELYPRTIRVNVPLTAQRTITLDDAIDTGNLIFPPDGASVTVRRTSAATGAFNLLVKNNAGSTLATLAAAGNGAECVFVGADWELVRTW